MGRPSCRPCGNHRGRAAPNRSDVDLHPAAGGMRPATVWRPVDGKGILEHYLGMPFGEIEKEYSAYVSQVAFEQFQAQWGS